MNLFLSPDQAHKELVNKLNGALSELRLLLSLPGAIRVDALYPLPLRHAPLVQKRAPIEITPEGEVDYRAEAIDALSAMWLRPGQHPKESLRSPGACGVSSAALAQLQLCNQIRMELIDCLAPLPAEKREQLWRAHHNISSHQTLRMPTVLSDPLKLRFYWDIGDSITRYTAKELLDVWSERLIALQGDVCAASQCEPDTLNFRLALSIERLSQLDSNEVVAVRRALPPHVRARVHDGNVKPYITSAPVPFVYSIASLPPSIKPLGNYDPEAPASTKKSGTRTKLQAKPFIEAMNVYRYKDKTIAIEPLIRESKRNTRKRPS